MINEYINNVNKRRKKQEYKELCFFGYGFGMFVTLIFFLKYLFNNENLSYDKFYILGILFGICILLFTIINPNMLKALKNIFNKIINLIFYVIFGVLLTVIYYLVISPIGFFTRLKYDRKNKSDTNFVERKDEDYSFKISYNKVYQLCQIFRLFFKKEYIILLPSIILIIILGILFVFLQSNIVAPFIYTLF